MPSCQCWVSGRDFPLTFSTYNYCQTATVWLPNLPKKSTAEKDGAHFSGFVSESKYCSCCWKNASRRRCFGVCLRSQATTASGLAGILLHAWLSPKGGVELERGGLLSLVCQARWAEPYLVCESYSGSLFLDAAVLDCVLTALISQSSSDASLCAQSSKSTASARMLGRVSLRCLQPNQERVLVIRYQPFQSAEITPIFTVSRQLPPQHAGSVGFCGLAALPKKRNNSAN